MSRSPGRNLAKAVAAIWIGLPGLILLSTLVGDLKSSKYEAEQIAMMRYADLVRTQAGSADVVAKICDQSSCSEIQELTVKTSQKSAAR